MRNFFTLFSFLIVVSFVYAHETASIVSTYNDSTLFSVESAISQDYRALSSSQADHVLSVIGTCKEIVLYCGHEGEVETYMVLCDYWKEKMNDQKGMNYPDLSSDFGVAYEIWVLGYDLHIADTICTPIDPSCMWFYKDGRIHNVGNFTSLDTEPRTYPFQWKVPQYRLISCLNYSENLQTTYHHDIHVFGHVTPSYYMSSLPSRYRNMRRGSQAQADRGYAPSGRVQANSPETISAVRDSTGGSISSVNQFDSVQVDSNTIQPQYFGQYRQQYDQRRTGWSSTNRTGSAADRTAETTTTTRGTSSTAGRTAETTTTTRGTGSTVGTAMSTTTTKGTGPTTGSTAKTTTTTKETGSTSDRKTTTASGTAKGEKTRR